MGFLTKGRTLDWKSAQKHIKYVKEHGVIQFLNIYKKAKERKGDCFLWGDEVECLLVTIDPVTKRVTLCCKAPEILKALAEEEEQEKREKEKKEKAKTEKETGECGGCGGTDEKDKEKEKSPCAPLFGYNAKFITEWGSFMVEATPSLPYGGHTGDLRLVEVNMALRRGRIENHLGPNDRLVTFVNFPLLGVFEKDLDQVASPHPRFLTLAHNIRDRRGGKVNILVPLFKDIHTNQSPIKPLSSLVTGGSMDDIKDIQMKTDENPSRSQKRKSPEISIHPLEKVVEEVKEKDSEQHEKKKHDTPSSTDILPPIIVDYLQSENPDIVTPDGNSIHMDHMCFGMGMHCLQTTFQARSLDEARQLYDQLAVMAPLMLAVTAATPFLRGRIADTDVRWSSISQSVDDRNSIERGEVKVTETSTLEGSLKKQKISSDESSSSSSSSKTTSVNSFEFNSSGERKFFPINKSRYDSIDCYIGSNTKNFKPAYNDLNVIYDEHTFQTLRKNGIDEVLALHVAHLFIRDPLVIYEGKVEEVDDDTQADHWENIQSTNWQTVRFKPPPPDDTRMGWRVEFRTMEIQLTDFENAAFSCFIALLARTILYFNLNLYIPISKVDENLRTAHKRDAIIKEKFYFRKNIKQCPEDGEDRKTDDYQLMSLEEIMCGKDQYPGLIPLVRTYLDMIKCDEITLKTVDKYFDLIERRVQGKLMTAAAFLRKFALCHHDYKQNSVLSHLMVYDMVEIVNQIAKGQLHVPQLLDRPDKLPADPQLESDRGPYLAGKMPRRSSLPAHFVELKLPNSQGCAIFRAFLEKNIRLSNKLKESVSLPSLDISPSPAKKHYSLPTTTSPSTPQSPQTPMVTTPTP